MPFERGVALAEHYNVDSLLRPIFDFVKGDQSPPLAPKHVTAASTRPRKPRNVDPKRKKVTVKRTAEEMMLLPPAQQPINYDVEPSSFSLLNQDRYQDDHNHPNRKRARNLLDPSVYEDDTEEDNEGVIHENVALHDRTYAQKLLQYFISDDTGIPAILLRPPMDLDVNVIIDDEGHTSLHWAAAMGRLKLVNILIDLGADIYRVNYKGQTALMRSVLFTNNFDAKSFLLLIEMLKKTIFNIDKKDQTVFHHVAATASWKGKVHASRYYMECLIATLSNNQSELISILNVQDVYGDTALSIAARIGNKKLVRLLMEAGASAEIANEEGMTAQDYLAEVDRNNRFQSPNQVNTNQIDVDSQVTAHPRSAFDHRNDMTARSRLRHTVEDLFKKIIVNDRSQPSIVSKLFDGFAGNYERELVQKEHMLREKRHELEIAKKKLAGTEHTSDQIQYDPGRLESIEEQTQELGKILKRQSLKIQKEFIEQSVSQNKNNEDTTASTNAEELLAQLKQLQEQRKQYTDQLVNLRMKIPSKRHQEYKRLISMCCNVSYENVDLMLLPLLTSFNELESHQNTASLSPVSVHALSVLDSAAHSSPGHSYSSASSNQTNENV